MKMRLIHFSINDNVEHFKTYLENNLPAIVVSTNKISAGIKFGYSIPSYYYIHNYIAAKMEKERRKEEEVFIG